MPDASPEWTPSVSTRTVSVPAAIPRREVVSHSRSQSPQPEVEADDEGGLADARQEMVDVVGQVVAARLLAGLDHDDAAAARHLLLTHCPQRAQAGIDRIAVVGAAAAIELVVLAHRHPGTHALRPALHLGLLVEMAVEQHRVVAVARHLDEDERRAAGQADHLQRGAGEARELRACPARHQLDGIFHVAVLGPLRIEGRRLVGNADVVRDRGQDRVLPRRSR